MFGGASVIDELQWRMAGDMQELKELCLAICGSRMATWNNLGLKRSCFGEFLYAL